MPMTPAVRQILLGEVSDPDVRDWSLAVAAAGGSLSGATRRAATTLVRSLKANGLWDKCYMIDLCAGDDLTAALTRLKVPSGVSRSYTNVNFVSGDYSETAGLTGNGTSKYLDSGLNPVSLGWDVSDLMLWCTTRTANVSAGTTRVSFGCDGPGGALAIGWVTLGSKDAVAIAGVGAGGGAAGSATPVTGLLGGGAAGSRSNQFYRSGAPLGAAGTAAGVSFASYPCYKFALNQEGTPLYYTPRTLSSAFVTRGLTAAEIVTLYNIVAEFEAALGRAV